jgi:hypothetical protein
MESAKSALLDQLQPTMVVLSARPAAPTKFLSTDNVSAKQALPTTQLIPALPAPPSPMDSSSMESAQSALEAWSITATPVPAPSARPHRDHSASVNAKVMSSWIRKETAIPAQATRSSPTEPVFVPLDTHSIHVESVLSTAAQDSSFSKEPVLPAP